MPTRFSISREDAPASARAVQLLVLVALLAAPVRAQTSVSEAGVGSIIIPVAYAADAEANAAGVRLAASPPAFFAVNGDTAPAALAPGQVGHFSFSYLVSQGAPLGPFSVRFTYADPPGTWESVDEEGISADFEVVPAPVPAGDTVPPTTSCQVEGTSFSDGHAVFVALPARVALSAVDLATPLSPASGVAASRYLLDSAFVDTITTPGILYAGEPVALAVGPHVFSYYSLDGAGNVEPLRVSSITVDATAPLISGLSPAGGEAFGFAVATFTVSWSVSDDLTPFSASGRLVQVEDRGVARGTAPAELVVTSGQTLQAPALDDGLWELRVSATDYVLNASSRSSGPFQIVRPEPPSPAAVPFPMVGVSSLTVAWVSTTNPVGTLYDAQLSTTADFSNMVHSSETYALSAVFSGLSPDTLYHARAAAYDPIASTWTEFSSLGSTVTATPPPEPSIADLTAEESLPLGERAQLRWTAPNRPSGPSTSTPSSTRHFPPRCGPRARPRL